MNTSKPCIFCGNAGRMTKEHLWPRWYGKMLVKKQRASYVEETFTSEGKSPRSLRSSNERQGDLTTMKFRIVCRSCNSGWMSELEQRVKPVLLSQLGNLSALSSENAKAIATWAVVKVMVAEFAEKNTQLTPAADRKFMSIEQEIPWYYSVYLGTHTTGEHVGYLRHSNTMSRNMAGPNPSIPEECNRNFQTVTFLLGVIVFHVVAKRIAGLEPGELIPPVNMHRIFPNSSNSYELALLPSLNQEALNKLSGWLDGVVRSPRVRHAGPIPVQN